MSESIESYARLGGDSLQHMLESHSKKTLSESSKKLPPDEQMHTTSIENVELFYSQLPSQFLDVELAHQIPADQLETAYKSDNFQNKINLSVEAFRTNENLPWVLPVVKYVEAQMAIDPLLSHECLPILGIPTFCSAALEYCLGKDSIALVENRAGAVQSLSGTGVMRLAAEFLYQFYNKRELSTAVYISDPNWASQYGVFKSAGFNDIRNYRYWDSENLCLDVSSILTELKNAPLYSIVVFQACAHNPTGLDPSEELWEIIGKICIERRLFPVFDCTYVGFASGYPDDDAWSVRYFVKLGFEMLVCQSFSNTFGLYDERAGALILVFRDAETQSKCRSQVEHIVRTMYSSPPSHGARLVATILNNPALFTECLVASVGQLLRLENLKIMVDRSQYMRHLLHTKLRIMGTPGNWNHIVNQRGMFAFTGFTDQQVNYLIKKKHIYILPSGRINVTCLTTSNLDYFVQSIDEMVRFFGSSAELHG